MDKRDFIKRSVTLLILFITEPKQFLNCISRLSKSSPSLKDNILHLYPNKETPFTHMLKHSKQTTLPKHLEWWNDKLEKL